MTHPPNNADTVLIPLVGQVYEVCGERLWCMYYQASPTPEVTRVALFAPGSTVVRYFVTLPGGELTNGKGRMTDLTVSDFRYVGSVADELDLSKRVFPDP